MNITTTIDEFCRALQTGASSATTLADAAHHARRAAPDTFDQVVAELSATIPEQLSFSGITTEAEAKKVYAARKRAGL